MACVERKPHVHVEQWEFGAYVSMQEVATLGEVARLHDVSEVTARRKLDGLVHQGLLEAGTVRGYGRVYRVPGAQLLPGDLDRGLASSSAPESRTT